MKQRTASLLKLLCLVLCLGMMLTGCKLTGCSGDNTPSGSVSGEAGESVTYSVEVVSQGGMPVGGVGVWIYADETKADLVWFQQTDAEGKITFEGKEGATYVAMLENVPEGYTVEEFYPITELETRIVLAGSMLSLDDQENVVYKLGDMMYDFSVTSADGTVYTLSELLKQKQAVVLNFWYGNCAPCKNEFPHLQAAYEKYSDKLEVLALNPVDTDPAVLGEIANALGLTFPMALVGSEWEQMFQIVGYPTTVIVDRYGMISFIHTGSITTEGVFEAVFDHFTSDDYAQDVVEDITEIVGDIDVNAGQTEGTEDDPIQAGASVEDGGTSMEVAVAANSVTYLEIYKLNNVYATIYDDDAYIIYNGKTYEASGGKVSVWLTTDDTMSGIKLGVGNSGDEDKTFTIKFVAKKGSHGNPYALELGEFTTKYAAGNDQGVYYSWTAPEDGVLTLTNVSCTKGVEIDYVLYNLNSYVYRTAGEAGTVSVEVTKGQKVSAIVQVKPDEKFNYPAATIKTNATFVAGEVEGVVIVEQIDYSVTVTELVNGVSTPKANVTFKVLVDGVEKVVNSDANGVANLRLPAGDYTWVMVVPNYYTAQQTSFDLTKDAPAAEVALAPVPQVDFTVNVVDDAGIGLAGVEVTMDGKFMTTDETGAVTFGSVYAGNYTISLSPVEGHYIKNAGYEAVVDENTTLMTIVLPRIHQYTVHVVDDDGAAVAGAAVTIGETTVTTDAAGAAVFALIDGSYTASVAPVEGYVVDENQSIAVEVAGGDGSQSVTVRKLHSYSVVVTDVDGGLAGLKVTIDGEDCVTDENGVASVLRVKGNYSYELSEVSVGYAVDTQAAEALTESVFTANVVLAYVPVSHSVTVIDQKGNPISGIEIQVDGVAECLVTNEAGQVLYDRDMAEHTVTVVVPDNYFGEYAYVSAKGETEVSVQLYSKATYTVNVVNDLGEAVEHVQLAVADQSGLGFPEVVANTDAEGKVVFKLPEDGVYVVRIVAYLGEGDYSYSTAAVAFGEEKELTLRMGENSMYTVEVLDETGAAVNGVTVQFYNGTSETPVEADTYNGKAVFEAVKNLGYYAVVLYDESKYVPVGDSASVEFGEETYACVKLRALVDYQLSVVDQNGAGVTADVIIDGNRYTAENGTLTVALPRGEHTLALGEVSGYRLVSGADAFDANNFAQFRLHQTGDYTVYLVDQDGNAVKTQTTVSVNGEDHLVSGGVLTLQGLDVGSYTATLTVPEGYRAMSDTVLAFGDGNEVTFQLMQRVTYTVRLVDYTGAVMTDVTANVKIGSTSAKATNGVATATLDAGSYDVSITFGGTSYGYQPAVVTASAPVADIILAPDHSGDYITENEVNYYVLTEGAFNVAVTPNGVTQFIFVPEEPGKYQFKLFCDASVAVLDYYGTSNYTYNSNTEMTDNTYVTDIHGGDLVMAIENVSATEVVLMVSRVDDVTADLPSVNYNDETIAPLDKWMTLAGFAKGKTLTAIDITVQKDYTLVKDSNGFYHLDSATGPLLLVDLMMPTLDLSNLVYNAPFCAWFNDAGEPVTYKEATYKEEYNSCMREYVDFIQGSELDTNPTYHFYTDSTGAGRSVYPLNDELMYMLKMGSANMGWFDADHENYFFGDTAVDEEDGWMYFLVYAE